MKKTIEKTITKFRAKLKNDGRSLKWWHEKYIGKKCRYDYFVRMVNNVECMKDDVFKVIGGYV